MATAQEYSAEVADSSADWPYLTELTVLAASRLPVVIHRFFFSRHLFSFFTLLPSEDSNLLHLTYDRHSQLFGGHRWPF